MVEASTVPVEGPAESPVQTGADRQKATQFGGPRSPRSGTGKPERKEVEPCPEPLRAMRFVAANGDARVDKDPLEKLYRKLLRSSPDKFANKLEKLEKEYAAGQAAGGSGGGPGVVASPGSPPPPLEDRSTERLIAYARERLRKLAGEG